MLSEPVGLHTSTQPKNVNMIFIHLEKSKMEAGGDVP